MIIKCKKSDEGKIISYIGKKYSSCLYLYLNLKKYGVESDVIGVYIQQDEAKITAVMLKYYLCMHIFSNANDFDTKELASFFCEASCSMIYCTQKTAELIYAALPKHLKEKATVTTGWVAQIKSVDNLAKKIAVSAKDSDFDQIVRLIYDDEDIGRSYKFNELAKQLKDRNKEGYARNKVIKNGDLVIAHACTNAECNNIAVVAELLVRKEYRRKGYASEIWRDICGELLAENKEVFSFYYSEESRRLHKHIGFQEVCEWAKVVIMWSANSEKGN